MDLLEVPGVSDLVKSLRDVVRLPLRVAAGMVRRVIGRPDAGKRATTPEHEIVAERFEAWVGTLRAEAQERAAGEQPRFAEVARRLADASFLEEMARGLEDAYGEYRPTIDAEIRERAQEIFRAIQERPVLLQALRGANLAVDTAGIVLVLKSGGINWSDAILGPAVAGIRRTLFEAGMERYLAAQERKLKDAQYAAMERIVLERLREPVRDLFRARFESGELERARGDFERVREAAFAVAREATA